MLARAIRHNCRWCGLLFAYEGLKDVATGFVFEKQECLDAWRASRAREGR